MSNKDDAIRIYGHISNWNVSNVTDMVRMFAGAIAFNQPIGNWNVSNVTNMAFMFDDARVFNQPIGNWDVSNVTDMQAMFEYARVFNQPIGNWNVSNVTRMKAMFEGTEAFNQPIGNWNVSNVMGMDLMFEGAKAFNQPIGEWNVSNVTSMDGMFARATSFNQPIGNWNVSNVTRMGGLFNGATVFNQPIGNWDVSNVTSMDGMFAGAIAFNQPIGNWNVSNVTDMQAMFDGAEAFNQDVAQWRLQLGQTADNRNIANIANIANNANNANNRKIAYEVHNSSAKINMKELINVLLPFVDDKFNHQIDMKTFILTKLNSFISKINNKALTSQLQQVQIRLNAMDYRDLSPNTIKSIFYALLYVNKQSDAFIEAYMSTFLEDCVNAYKGDGNTMSCSAGILERMVTSLVQACTFEKSTDKENETCDTIINIIDNNPNKMIPIAIQDWYKLHSTPKGKFPDDMAVDDKKRNLKKFLFPE